MGSREMLERLYAQLEAKREEVREAEAAYEELTDDKDEKLGEFIVASIAQGEGGEKLKAARDVVDNIQRDIDVLLGV